MLKKKSFNKEIDSFLKKGFVIIKIKSLENKIPYLLKIYDELIAKAEELGKNGLVKIRKSNNIQVTDYGWSWGCDHIFSPPLYNQELLDIVSLDPLPILIKNILGSKVRFSGGHGHWSPQNYDYYLHWHRDTRRHLWKFGNTDPRAHIQVCIALMDESVIRIVPGSHLRDLSSEEEVFLGEFHHHNHPNQVIINIPAGHALLFNTYTFHRAQCEKENTRRSLHFGFTRVDSKPEPGRQGKKQEWMHDKEFINKQTKFLQECIYYQIEEDNKSNMELFINGSI